MKHKKNTRTNSLKKTLMCFISLLAASEMFQTAAVKNLIALQTRKPFKHVEGRGSR